jgi:hypothetical protein
MFEGLAGFSLKALSSDDEDTEEELDGSYMTLRLLVL